MNLSFDLNQRSKLWKEFSNCALQETMKLPSTLCEATKWRIVPCIYMNSISEQNMKAK